MRERKRPEIDASKIIKQVTITVRVKGLKRLKFRCSIGFFIAKLGFSITGMKPVYIEAEAIENGKS